MGITTSTPQTVPGLRDVVGISGSLRFACAQIADGGTNCWGDNRYGSLGDGTTIDRAVPVQVKGLRDVRSVEAVALTPCAIHHDGGLSCWGHNDDGEVGDGTTIARLEPVPVPLPGAVERLGHFDSHRAVLADGSAWAWGYNDRGSVGPSASPYLAPWAVGLTSVREFASTWYASCALRTDGSVWCWGNNEDGAVGDPTVTGRVWPPRKVPNITNAVQLVATLATFCVLTADGRPYCWGGNLYGEVGDGTVISRAYPTPVLW